MIVEKMHKRISCIFALIQVLKAEILPSVRLISIEWDQDEPTIYFYVDEEVTEDLIELIDEPFHHYDIDAIEDYKLVVEQVKTAYPIDYKGDCCFARKEPFLGLQDVFENERSWLIFSDEELLKKPKQILKTFRKTELQGGGELADFEEPIGYYLNPITKESILTTKAVIYYGKKTISIFPAAPHFSWFETLVEEFKKEKLSFNWNIHIAMESIRALLGRVVPGLYSFESYNRSGFPPDFFSFTVSDSLSEDDRETLEQLFFEIQAAVPQEIDFDVQFLSSNSAYEAVVAGFSIYIKKMMPGEWPKITLTRLQKIERRLHNLVAVEACLKGKIPFGTRLISVSWITKPICVEFTFQLSPEITEKERNYFTKQLDELCKQVASDPSKPYGRFIWSDADVAHYFGECIFAVDPREKGKIFHRDPYYYEELSTCTHFDTKVLLEQKSKDQVLKRFCTPELQGHGELVEFKTVIGTYLNPTTHESSTTKKALVYYGVKDVEVIPAVPDPNWFLELQKEFATENKTIDFSIHMQREAHRALLGRVPSSLVAMTLAYTNEPFMVTFYVTAALGRLDRILLELVFFEMMAGMPVELEFQTRCVEVKDGSEVDQSDYCVYLRKGL